ncbi:efflux RND transporter permease subunit [Desulfobacula phenolica]|uniref:Multidrug efflux pump subunit AcrB n=1 Tax=Desulfobacula phenolica TaxID=90732 RepID=A0A1H2IFA1_9BACT|nr:efflux RND transporter permease subunit [Desulfobacula phenolica]SDU42829.1 Multidrug efflux pump subunit AcrB [Desulfobacula phenolica]
MNLAVFALRKRTLMVVITLLLVGIGMVSFQGLGRLEDPTFTIKTALIVTRYPGASPLEVEEEVTDRIEEAIKSMGQVKEIYSTSSEGVSFVYVDMKDRFKSRELPQIWDELRRKISDIQNRLPPGAGPSIVNDDFGDVYGQFFAITGKDYTYAQLKEFGDYLKKELLLCEDVAKIDFWGTRQEAVYIEFQRSKLAELGLSLEQVGRILHSQNLVQQSGRVDVDTEYMRITSTGEFKNEIMIADLLVGGAGGLIRLGDIAEIYRGYTDPPRNIMRYNGQPAIGMGISTIDGGNVITMGKSVKQKLADLKEKLPDDIELNIIYYQSDIVTESVNAFLLNLVEALVIVIVLLMLFMGWQSGLLIGIILLLTILGTFIGMSLMSIDLHKISLGALILALGMLVDNAIVIADGILVRMQRGKKPEDAAKTVVQENQWPLFGATIVSILSFAAIGYAPGDVGEFCRSLFQVIAISLLMSWILAVTITPLFCVWFLKVRESDFKAAPYDRPWFRFYRRMLHYCIKHWTLTGIVTVVLLVTAIIGFGRIPQSFFPNATQRYFYVNLWKPQGTHISHTSRDLDDIQKHLSTMDGIKNITSFVGEGAMRFILSYSYQSPNAAYGQLLVEVDEYREIDRLIRQTNQYLETNFPDSEPYCLKIVNGPPVPYLVELRFRGPDIQVLKSLSDKALDIMQATANIRDIRTDWRQMVRVIRPEFSETQARRIGVTRQDLATALQWNFNGIAVGLYRENDELLPIITRPPESERTSVDNLSNIQVWSSLAGTFVPIRQVITGIHPEWEWPLIQRREQQRAVTVRCNPVQGLADPLRNQIKEQIEAIVLPPGYTMEWAGEHKESVEGREPLKKIFPLCLLCMFVTVVWLFNSIRRPLIIFLTVPLSLVGITAGLLVTNLAFGFMAILGFLGLSGMLIKNAIVLIEQIEIFLSQGIAPYKAILDASVSRMRPVVMASGTTILGMAPLMFDPLFSSMAVTIMGGLFAATFLTLIIVPVLYSLMYAIKAETRFL